MKKLWNKILPKFLDIYNNVSDFFMGVYDKYPKFSILLSISLVLFISYLEFNEDREILEKVWNFFFS
jgi:hypothetical protein